MADKTINLILRIRDEASAILTKLRAESTATATSISRANATMNAGGGGAGNFANNLFKAREALSATTGEADRLAGAVKNLALGFLGIGIIASLKNVADMAARVETLSVVLDVVAANAGITSTKIQQVDQSVQKLGITSSASKEALTAFIQAGLDIDKAAPLARAAQDLAVVAGKNSSDLFRQVITNVQQLDTVGLRYNGIVLDMDKVTDQYAKTLGKSANELTRAEKQAAVLNGVLDKGKELNGVYERSLGAVGKQVQSLKRYKEELAVSAGQNLLPVYSLLVREFTTFLQVATQTTDEFGRQGKAGEALAERLKPIVVALREIGLFLVEHAGAVATVVVAYAGLSVLASVISSLGVILSVVPKVIAVWKLFSATIIAWKAAAAAAFVANPLLLGLVVLAGIVTQGILLWQKYKKSKEDALRSKNPDPTAGGTLPTNATAEDREEALANRILNRKNLTKELADAEVALIAAQKAGDHDAVDAATKKREEIKKRIKATEDEIAAIRRLHEAQGGSFATADAKANEKARELARAKELEQIDTDMRELKVSADTRFRGLNISEPFSKEFGLVSNIVDAFNRKLQTGTGDSAVSLGALYGAFNELANSAKSFDEITRALEVFTTSYGRLLAEGRDDQTLRNLIDTTRFRQAKVAIDEVNKSIEGYREAVKITKQQADLSDAIGNDAIKFTADLKSQLGQLGAAAAVGTDGLVNLSRVSGGLAQQRAATAQEELAAIKLVADANRNKYISDLAQIETVAARQRATVEASVADAATQSQRLIAIERDTAIQRQAAAKTYYDALKQQQGTLQQQLIDGIRKVKDLETQRADNATKKEEALRNLRLSGMTEEQRRIEDNNRFAFLGGEAQEKMFFRQYDAAKKAADEQLRIAEAAASTAKTDQERVRAQQMLEEAYGNQDKLAEKMGTDQKKRNADLATQLNSTTDALAHLRSVIEGLGEKLTLGIDTSAFDQTVATLRQKLTDGLKNIQITLIGNVATDGTDAPRRAQGGLLSGPGTGTSDSILMWGSNGEFVMRASAVQQYGLGFMDAVNQGRFHSLPRFSEGGAVGELGAPGGDNVYVSIGGKQVGPLRGNKKVVRDFVSALKGIEGGIG